MCTCDSVCECMCVFLLFFWPFLLVSVTQSKAAEISTGAIVFVCIRFNLKHALCHKLHAVH